MFAELSCSWGSGAASDGGGHSGAGSHDRCFMTLRASVATCPSQAHSVLVTARLCVILQVASWNSHLPPYTTAHFCFDQPPRIWVSHSSLPLILLLNKQVPQALKIIYLPPLPTSLFLSYVNLFCILLQDMHNDLSMFLVQRHEFLWAPLRSLFCLVIFLFQFFFSPSVEAVTHIKPPPSSSSPPTPSCCLLLFLQKPTPNSVNSQALSAAVVVSLQFKVPIKLQIVCGLD